MSKIKLERNLYTIHKYDFKSLLDKGHIDANSKVLVCDKQSISLSSEIYDGSNHLTKKAENFLFDQTKKEFAKDPNAPSWKRLDCFEKVYVIISFEEYIRDRECKDKLNKVLERIEDGILLNIDNEKILFKDFLKSNSMSKECCVMYVNEYYKERIEKRVAFGFNKGEINIPKWYAYSGFSLSDIYLLDEIKLKPNEIIVVPDKEINVKCDCITGVSDRYLEKLLDKLKDELNSRHDEQYKSKKEINSLLALSNDGEFAGITNVVEQLECFYNSESFKRIKNEVNDNSSDLNTIYQKYIVKTLTETHKIISKTFKDNIHFNLLANEVARIIYFKGKLSDSVDEYYKKINTINPHEVYWENFFVKNFPSKINMFDGEGLMSKDFCARVNTAIERKKTNKNEVYVQSLSEEDEYIDENTHFNSIQIRLPFIKGVLHSVDFKAFFKAKNIKYLYGLTYNKNGSQYKRYEASKVKVILTESQFKAAKFMKKWQDNPQYCNCSSLFDEFINQLNEYNYALGIAGYESASWQTASLNYQFISTIPSSDEYVDYLKNKMTNYVTEKTSQEYIKDYVLPTLQMSGDEVKIINKYYDDFYIKTEHYKKIVTKNFESIKKNLYLLKVENDGCRKYLCGDLLELLYHSCFFNEPQKIGNIEQLGFNEFYAPNSGFEDSFRDTEFDRYLVLRNPHYARNEIAVMSPYKNIESEHYLYFNHLTGVLMFNPRSFNADRLAGADFDGDTVVILNDDEEIRKKYCEKLMDENGNYLYPLIKIPSLSSLTKDMKYNFENKVLILKQTFDSRVGLISNLALKNAFNNYIDDSIMNMTTPFFTILSGLEIDSAKNGLKPSLPESGDLNSLGKDYLEMKTYLIKREKDVIKNFEKEYKNKIVSTKDKHHIFNLLSHILSFKCKRVNINKFDFNYREDRLSNEYEAKVIAACKLYDRINNQKRKERAQNSLNKNLEGNLNLILQNKDKDLGKILKKFNVSNATDVLRKYCDSSSNIRFHYLTKKEDKVKYIKHYLGLKHLDDDLIDDLCDFSNGGFYLLYLLLLYKKDKFEYDAFKSFEFNDLEATVNKSCKDVDPVVRELVVKEIENIIDEFKDAYDDDSNVHFNDQFMVFLRRYVKDVPFDNYLKYTDRKLDREVIFAVFAGSLLKYLDDTKGGLTDAD